NWATKSSVERIGMLNQPSAPILLHNAKCISGGTFPVQNADDNVFRSDQFAKKLLTVFIHFMKRTVLNGARRLMKSGLNISPLANSVSLGSITVLVAVGAYTRRMLRT